MTGGLAHEIRNPLSTVGLNAALLREMIEDAMEPDLKHRALKRLDALGGKPIASATSWKTSCSTRAA